MSKRYYGFEYWSGRQTTTGEPNKKTGYFSTAGSVACFKSIKDRDEWVNKGRVTSDVQGNCRIAVTKKQLRKKFLGLSIEQYEFMLEMLGE